jgi:hypothetical protein
MTFTLIASPAVGLPLELMRTRTQPVITELLSGS